MTDDAPLTLRRLNRALLARQLLLERSPLDPVAAVAHLGGVQAQEPEPPFLGLWSRLRDVARPAVIDLLAARRIVRGTTLRGTIHWTTAEDYVAFRRTLQPVLDRALQQPARRPLLAVPGLVDRARALLADEPRTIADLREPLAAAWPDRSPADLAMVARMTLPLLMVPDPAQRTGFPARARFALAEELLGRPIAAQPAGSALLRRYLLAFGPATAADATTWSGLTGTRALLQGIEDVVVLRDEEGRELFDVAGAPLPAEDVPAPVRFLPAFDNAILSHADRRRIIRAEDRDALASRNGMVPPTVLHDGEVAATWTTVREGGRARIGVVPLRRLSQRARAAIRAEGRRALRFLAPGAPGDVVVD